MDSSSEMDLLPVSTPSLKRTMTVRGFLDRNFWSMAATTVS